MIFLIRGVPLFLCVADLCIPIYRGVDFDLSTSDTKEKWLYICRVYTHITDSRYGKPWRVMDLY